MSSPVSSNTNTSNLFFDEEFEKEVVAIMKKEAQEALQKTSDQAKKAMKKQVEGCAK